MTNAAAKPEPKDPRIGALENMIRVWAHWQEHYGNPQESLLGRIVRLGPVGAMIRSNAEFGMPRDVERVERALVSLRHEEREVVVARFMTRGKERDKAKDCEITYAQWRLRIDRAYWQLIGNLGL